MNITRSHLIRVIHLTVELRLRGLFGQSQNIKPLRNSQRACCFYISILIGRNDLAFERVYTTYMASERTEKETFINTRQSHMTYNVKLRLRQKKRFLNQREGIYSRL